MSRSRVALFGSVGLASMLALGCARQHVMEAPIRSARAPVVMSCPLGVPHAHIDVVETPVGADVRFTTTEQRVADLRRRVQDQTQVRGPGQHLGTGHLGEHGHGHDHGMRLWELPPHQAVAAEVPGGSVLQVTAAEPARRDELVTQLKARVERLEGRPCP